MSDFHAHVSTEAAHNIEVWLREPKYASYKDELELMIREKRWQELEDAFFKVLEFGTAGRRGVVGVGSNRINFVTIGESAQALCEYILEFDSDAAKKGIVIAYDTRLSSPELSRYSAQVCAANGFKVYLFEDFRSTPELSFAVRHFGAAAGIVISASHNPPSDNGFKAYWSDGAQIASPHDTGILAKAAEITEIKVGDYETLVEEGRIVFIGADVDELYLDAVISEAEGDARNVHIVYSPLHGAGQTNTLPALRRAGFVQITCVEEQMSPDGNFPTVPSGKPNPQEQSANDMAVALMHKSGADLAITNDPDADRLGVAVRQERDTVYLTGNQAYILAADYSLAKLQQRGELRSSHYIVNTFVTTDMGKALASHYDVTCYDTLPVGFKYVGALIREKEDTDETFVVGGEESYGALKGTYARDKDGASAALPIVEYAAELKIQNKTLYDRLLELYAQHGVYVERMDNVDLPGADGFAKMHSIMKMLRETPPRTVGEYAVTAVYDYQNLQRMSVSDGRITEIDSIANNTIAIELGDYRRRLIIRPSGTEPKLKIYGMWFEPSETQDVSGVSSQYARIDRLVENLASSLGDTLLS